MVWSEQVFAFRAYTFTHATLHYFSSFNIIKAILLV